ncbi:glyoxalase-like domain-containing protein [Abortiporus biennis]|nr:glyoxalase-like domain-containing protein [Abortiporus biennis]
MTTPPTNTLDHIVHLSPPGSLKEISAKWKDLGFNVVQGGKHADGLTENALVAFEDGSYIELISFTNPITHYPPDSPSRRAREKHPWGKKEPGYIDFALLGNNGEPSIAATINKRAEEDESGVKYEDEVNGGRTRTDGEILKWLITAPSQSSAIGGGDIRGRLPFFCGDLTPRNLRVPHEKTDITHPNTAVGIAFVRILTSHDQFDGLRRQYGTILHASSTSSEEVEFSLKTPAVDSTAAPSLFLRPPQSESEKEWLKTRGAGLYEVGVKVQDSSRVAETSTPYGRIITLSP